MSLFDRDDEEEDVCRTCGRPFPEPSKEWVVILRGVPFGSGKRKRDILLARTTEKKAAKSLAFEYRCTGYTVDIVEASEAKGVWAPTPVKP